MRTRCLILAGLLSAAALCIAAEPGADADPKPAANGDAAIFLDDVRGKVADSEKAGRHVLESKDGWLFFVGELRSLSVGPFWGEAAAKVSRTSREKFADPLPAILEFKKQCDDAGVELLLVPVPAKATIYPELVSDTIQVALNGRPPRVDVHLQAFYALLRENGVQVLDLTDALLDKRYDPAGNMYCKHDTHWSSRACRLAASVISEQMKDRKWLREATRTKFVTEERPLAIKGDLWGYLKDREPQAETLPMIHVGTKEGDDKELQFVARDRNSPVVLIGDSHTLVFNAGGDLHTRGAGLPDHLAPELGFAVDHIGVRGAGTTVPRIELARRKDDLASKKLVIWCFSSRQFTESTNGWMTGIPVVKPKPAASQ